MKTEIRQITESEYPSALSLVWKVFSEYEAPEYTDEGIDEFQRSINNPSYLSQLSMFGAFCRKGLVGVIATRNQGTHIALFFVDGEYQRKGIGWKLFQEILGRCDAKKLTVNSSPFAVPAYRRLGFVAAAPEQIEKGIRFTPMYFDNEKKACPCKREKCIRHGNCEACRAHHAELKLKCFCERG